MKNRPSIRTIVTFISALAFAILVSTVAAYFFTDDAEAKPVAPKTLIGTWHQTESGIDGIIMVAEIREDTIEVDLKTRDDAGGLYWLGTFNGTKDPAGKFIYASEGDADAMRNSMFGSQDSGKSFVYEDGDLSFNFKMLGKSTTVHLEKK